MNPRHGSTILAIPAAILAAAVLTACAAWPLSLKSAAQTPGAGPVFTHPTDITNPYFPVSLAAQAIYLGVDGQKPTRDEVTLLPTTVKISWEGQQIEARVAQFVGYTNGKLVEVAYDYYAQADDGSLYYLGEDVSNYANGNINHEGSWRAGKGGAPPSLIMPAHPQVGQKFNPENLPGVVFETDEVLSVSEKANTPSGVIDNGILIKETLMEGTIEHKVYAPNFGIVLDQGGSEELKLVLLNRTDAKPGIVPEALTTIENQAEDIFDGTPGGQWDKVSADIAAIREAWQAYQPQAENDRAPKLFQEALTAAFDRLQKSAAVKDIAGTLQAANDLSAAVADLYTVYNPKTPSDLGRLDVLERQVGLDAAAKDHWSAADTLAKANAVWTRVKPVLLAHNGADTVKQYETSLALQQAALEKGDAAPLANEAQRSLELIDALERLL